MPIEAATYIDDLNASNPPHTDQLSEADDHMRLIKSVLLNSFPNVDAPVTDTPATMNSWEARIAANETDIAGKLEDTGPDTFTGELTVDGNLIVTGDITVTGEITAFAPGMIQMWYGTLAAIPTGWVICDGTLGTPDLTAAFPYGAGNDGEKGLTGGGTSYTTDSDGSHTHGNTGSAGDHDHTGQTGWHTLTVAQIPAHDHLAGKYQRTEQSGETLGSTTPVGSVSHYREGGYGTQNESGQWPSEETGGGASHRHSISSESSHVHTTSSGGAHTHGIVNVLPPYVRVYFIQKT